MASLPVATILHGLTKVGQNTDTQRFMSRCQMLFRVRCHTGFVFCSSKGIEYHVC